MATSMVTVVIDAGQRFAGRRQRTTRGSAEEARRVRRVEKRQRRRGGGRGVMYVQGLAGRG